MSILKKILKHFSAWLSILISLNIVLNISSKLPSIGSYLILIWLIAWLVIFKTNKQHRYQHIVFITADIVVTLLLAILLYYFLQHFNQLIINLPALAKSIVINILSLFHVSLPSLQIDMLKIFSILYVCIILMLRASLCLILKSHSDTVDAYFQRAYEVAYIPEDSAMSLKPWLTFARPFAFVLLLIGIGIFMWYFLAEIYDYSQTLLWLVWFFNLFIIIGIDWYLWLSGNVHQFSFEPSFDGSQADADKQLTFEELWKRYHKFWKDKWLVAGNISTGPKKDG